jgi:uncharacterized membrane protein
MRSDGTRVVVTNALFVALVALATMVIQVPTPATGGFINVGDTMIFAAALVLGPRAGMVAGGVGSALADLLTGYAHWAPWTLVIKGFEGLVVGLLGYASYRNARSLTARTVGAMALGAAWMVTGYFGAAVLMKGWAAALTSVPENTVQGVASIVLASTLLTALRAFRR